MKTAVVTGASGGIGLATAQLLVSEGFTVYSLSRRPSAEGIRHLVTDVSDEASVRLAFDTIRAEQGGIDVLVNNAGFGISGAAELTDLAEAKKMFDVNFFGALACIRCALPLLREKHGCIVNLSSVAAVLPVPYQSMYSCCKAATNALTLALRNEVSHMGVRVCAVMPGDVKTGFTAARVKSTEGETLYGERIARAVGQMERDEQNGMPPSVVARKIVRLAQKKSPKPLTVAGASYRVFALLAKVLPARLVNALEGKLYG